MVLTTVQFGLRCNTSGRKYISFNKKSAPVRVRTGSILLDHGDEVLRPVRIVVHLTCGRKRSLNEIDDGFRQIVAEDVPY